jgi:anti-sigma B factor antagonist
MESKQIKLEVKDVEARSNTKVVEFDGDLDSTNVESTLDKVNAIYGEGNVNIVADFSKLRYVNSTGLGILLHISKTAKNSRCTFKIAKVNDNVFEIIEIIGANTLLDLYDTIEDALQSLD